MFNYPIDLACSYCFSGSCPTCLSACPLILCGCVQDSVQLISDWHVRKSKLSLWCTQPSFCSLYIHTVREHLHVVPLNTLFESKLLLFAAWLLHGERGEDLSPLLIFHLWTMPTVVVKWCHKLSLQDFDMSYGYLDSFGCLIFFSNKIHIWS